MCSKEAVLASIHKKHKRWEVRVRRGNNPTKCKSFTKLADAKIWAYQTELELERPSAVISPTPIKLTLNEAKKCCIDSIVIHHKDKDSETYRLDAIISRLGQRKDIWATLFGTVSNGQKGADIFYKNWTFNLLEHIRPFESLKFC